MMFAEAVSKKFPQSRCFQVQGDGSHPIVTKGFNPNGATYFAVFGFPAAGVGKPFGWPLGQMQHGQRTDIIGPLLGDPTFLAEAPEFAGVVYGQGTFDEEILKFCVGPSGPLYSFLFNHALKLGMIGPTGPVAPTPGRPDDGPRKTPPAPVPNPAVVPTHPGPVAPPAPPLTPPPASADPKAALIAAIQAYAAVAAPNEAPFIKIALDYFTTGKTPDLKALLETEAATLLAGQNPTAAAVLGPILNAVIEGKPLDNKTLAAAAIALLLGG